MQVSYENLKFFIKYNSIMLCFFFLYGNCGDESELIWWTIGKCVWADSGLCFVMSCVVVVVVVVGIDDDVVVGGCADVACLRRSGRSDAHLDEGYEELGTPGEAAGACSKNCGAMRFAEAYGRSGGRGGSAPDGRLRCRHEWA